ncbi:hypothetical protein WJX72_011515 [[Myrmecia] bisecta]|uniref:Rhodanese domain-containing protein n=1 Tax=[Myrmecia] bisecta TaxID=41462 RepID=A0AAW1QGV3_9CHLO
MWEFLVAQGLKSISPEEAQERVKAGTDVLVDVRPAEAYEKAHPEGALSAPMFQVINLGTGFSLGRLAKAAAMAANGVTPTERNPNFVQELKKAAGDKGVILFCEAGGTLLPSANFATGKTSRSLKASYTAIAEAGLKKVAHLDGGAFGWFKAGLPFDGEYDTSNVGRTPNAALPAAEDNQQ